MASFTRLTVVGSTRRAEVVVPSDEGVGAMLADLLDLLGEAPGTVPHDVVLVRLTGDQVDLALDAAEQGLADGEVLRVVRTGEAPPPPDVADVTDATAERLAARTDRWDATVRRLLAAVVTGLATTLALLGVWFASDDSVGFASATVLAAVATGVVVATARSGHRHTARTGLAVALGATAVLGLAGAALMTGAGSFAGLSDVAGGGTVTGLTLAARLGGTAAWLVLAVGGGALRIRGAGAGGVLGAVMTGSSTLLQLYLPGVQADAVTAVLAVLVTGLLPWWAMTTAGLTGLDDAVTDTGQAPARSLVHTRVEDAYAGLGWSTVAVALPLTVATVGLLGSGLTAGVLLGGAVVVVTALRTRSLPLRHHALTLWAAALVPVGIGALGLISQAPAAAAAGLAVLGLTTALLAGTDPSGQQRARVRQLGDRVEQLTVLTLLPLVLGVFGVYGALLGAF